MYYVLESLGRALGLVVETIALLSAWPQRGAPKPLVGRLETWGWALVAGLSIAFGSPSFASAVVLTLPVLAVPALLIHFGIVSTESIQGARVKARTTLRELLRQLTEWIKRVRVKARLMIRQLRRQLRKAGIKHPGRIILLALAVGLAAAFVASIGDVVAGVLIGLVTGAIVALPQLKLHWLWRVPLAGAIATFVLDLRRVHSPVGFLPTLAGVGVLLLCTFALRRPRTVVGNLFTVKDGKWLSTDEERRWLSWVLGGMAAAVAAIVGLWAVFLPLWPGFLVPVGMEFTVFLLRRAASSYMKLHRDEQGLMGEWPEERGRHPYAWAASVSAFIAIFLAILDLTIVNNALFSIQGALEASRVQLVWIVDSYTLAFGALLLPAGWLADRFGRRKLLMGGMALFASASVLAPVVHSIAWLVVWRTAMGAGSGVAMPSTLSTVIAMFPRKGERRIGHWSEKELATVLRTLVGVIALATGPVVGGALIQEVVITNSWRLIFYVSAGVALFGLIAARLRVPDTTAEVRRPPDRRGIALSITGVAAITAALIEAPVTSWVNPLILLGLVGGVVLLVLFGRRERRAGRNALLDLSVFADRRYTAAVVANGLAYGIVGGVLFLLSIYLQARLGQHPLGAGLWQLWTSAGIVIGAAVFFTLRSIAVRRFGEDRLFTALTAAGFLLIVGVTAYDATAPLPISYAGVLVLELLVGAGAGLSLPVVSQWVMKALVPSNESPGTAGREVSTTVGITLVVALVSMNRDMLTHGALLVLAILAAIAFVTVLLVMGAGGGGLARLAALRRRPTGPPAGQAGTTVPEGQPESREEKTPTKPLPTLPEAGVPETPTLPEAGVPETPTLPEAGVPKNVPDVPAAGLAPTPPNGLPVPKASGGNGKLAEPGEGAEASIQGRSAAGPYDPDNWPINKATIGEGVNRRPFLIHDNGKVGSNGPVVVWIGGLATPVGYFGKFLGVFGDRRVLAMDNPGQGHGTPTMSRPESPALHWPLWFRRSREFILRRPPAVAGYMGMDPIVEEAADDWATILEHLQTGPVVIYCHSFGFSIAGTLAAKHPELVSQVCCFGSATTFVAPKQALKAARSSAEMSEGQVDSVRRSARLLKRFTLIARWPIPRFLEQLIAPVLFRMYIGRAPRRDRPGIRQGDAWLLLRMAIAVRFADLTPLAEAVRRSGVPVLAAVTGGDRQVLPSLQEALARAAGAQHIFRVNTGHNPITDADETAWKETIGMMLRVVPERQAAIEPGAPGPDSVETETPTTHPQSSPESPTENGGSGTQKTLPQQKKRKGRHRKGKG